MHFSSEYFALRSGFCSQTPQHSMASCSFGTSNVKVLNLDIGRKKLGTSQQYGTRSWTCRRTLQCADLVKSQQRKKTLTPCCNPSLKIQSVSKSEDSETKSDDVSEETKFSALTSELILKFNEVEFLLEEVCQTSSIAEVELKCLGFHLRIVRDLTGKIGAYTPPAPASVSESRAPEAPKDLNGSVSTSSLSISKPVSSSEGIQTLLDKAADEGLVIIQSSGVGFFRRSRTIKGNRTPPSCKEKQIVKEGQTVCYIEELGGEVPIKSDVAGEVIKILREDGEPVGYGDALIAVLPSFPGIKKLQ
ncbi:hypothetical protein L6164_021595 [Bauhinia variegata]|uniref:Uncharacterized protein n=1 Tax=Bauhinia variegata TaxID=167791 RepID=A0ACB9N040_BAUVA|nr:hypothetical protein L6164_021595 [Bauhinia variegata]